MSYEVNRALEHLTRKIDEKVREIEGFLGDGSVKNYEEYRQKCGEITGLLTTRRFMQDLTEVMEQDDE